MRTLPIKHELALSRNTLMVTTGFQHV